MEAAFGQRAAGSFHMRWLGQPAFSGMRQAVFTFFNEADAQVGIVAAWDWYSVVPSSIDARGIRMMPVRWMHP